MTVVRFKYTVRHAHFMMVTVTSGTPRWICSFPPTSNLQWSQTCLLREVWESDILRAAWESDILSHMGIRHTRRGMEMRPTGRGMGIRQLEMELLKDERSISTSSRMSDSMSVQKSREMPHPALTRYSLLK